MVLGSKCLLGGGIAQPGPGYIAQIASRNRVLAQTEPFSENLNDHFIQAPPRNAYAITHRLVESVRDASNRVLHAPIVGSAYSQCKQGRA